MPIHSRAAKSASRACTSALLLSSVLLGCGGDAVNAPAIRTPIDSTSTAPPTTGPVASAADTAMISVDQSVRYQTIAGFGGTTLPLVYGGTDYLGALRASATEAAFSKVGISRGLLQIGVTEAPAGAVDPYGQRGNDNADPFVINPGGFNFNGLATLRSAIIVPASRFGFTSLELGPMLDLRFSFDWLKTVRAASYNRYLDESAESVLAALQQWRSAYGATPQLIHLFNEPTSGNMELGSTSVQEVVDLVKRVGTRLRASGFAEVKFIVPNEETMRRSLEVSRAILQDPVARPFVGVIGFHQYPYGSVSTSPRRLLETSGEGSPDASTRSELEQLRSLGTEYGVPLWMTEVSEGPGTSDYDIDAIENVLARSIHIHDTFRYGSVQAYFGMNTIWDSRSHAEHFAGRNIPFLKETSSIVLVDVERGRVQITGMGYAIGHYARWLRAGTRRLETSSSVARVPSLAFQDGSGNRVVVVATNASAKPQLIRVRIAGAAPAGTFSGEVSSQSVRWQAITGTISSATGIAEFLAPARSVVTMAIPLR